MSIYRNSGLRVGRERENPPKPLDGFTLRSYASRCRFAMRECISPGRVFVAQTRRAVTSQHFAGSRVGTEVRIGQRDQTVRGPVLTYPFYSRGDRSSRRPFIQGGNGATPQRNTALTESAPTRAARFTAAPSLIAAVFRTARTSQGFQLRC
jgi:hypothetical protein